MVIERSLIDEMINNDYVISTPCGEAILARKDVVRELCSTYLAYRYGDKSVIESIQPTPAPVTERMTIAACNTYDRVINDDFNYVIMICAAVKSKDMPSGITSQIVTILGSELKRLLSEPQNGPIIYNFLVLK